MNLEHLKDLAKQAESKHLAKLDQIVQELKHLSTKIDELSNKMKEN